MKTAHIFQKTTIAFICVFLFSCGNSGQTEVPKDGASGPIPVGVLHSLTGTMAISEQGVVNATLLAIEEINAAGGVNGRKIEATIRDGASSGQVFAREAERLITEDQVDVVFGCWTSDSRKTVRPVFEQYDHLLFYPVQYEGMELSPNIVYTGAAPNQQIMPAVKWAMDNLGDRFYLVGSDYVFPHAANAIIKDQVQSLGGQILGEAYVLLGSTAVDLIADEIARLEPDVILNTLNGDSNIAFFEALRLREITPDLIPTISFSIAETELLLMGSAPFEGDYAAWNYFQSVPGSRNETFVAAYRAMFGSDAVINDPMEAAYTGVYLWALAAEEAGSTSPEAVRNALGGLSLDAPHGPVSIDGDTQHLWKTVRIGQIRADGQFDIVWSTTKPVRPLPYPSYRSPQDWQQFLDELYRKWGGNWARQAEISEVQLP
ncbi:urea transport system substrate-binding protein [Cyclonatronum proteinivorum]|uniref:Urea transport system substrate-binding protein n=1 Tax=Cyclonatronum proteinivorum TaxID=1457365 RepID=A0A345UFX3_9BACT|nr:urea ABC transporter substrate-binding protein [Cyclonatronum proteinivorum]AXI99374.1 urea transport system substrate-binding protein [Cyclonatronum proteinivorum]